MFETMFTSPAALSRNRNGLLAAEVELARRRRPSKPVRPRRARPVTTRHSHLAQRDSTLMTFLDSL